MSRVAAILLNPPNPPGYVSNKDSMGGFGQLFHEGAPPFPSALVTTARIEDVLLGSP